MLLQVGAWRESQNANSRTRKLDTWLEGTGKQKTQLRRQYYENSINNNIIKTIKYLKTQINKMISNKYI